MAEQIQDPFCLPDNPIKITYNDVKEAYELIKNTIVRTNCVMSHLQELTGMEVYLKQEFMQYTGSFKERGARYALEKLSSESNGVIAASYGNYAQALSYHGKLLGIPVTVVLPKIAPLGKIQKCSKYGATIIVEGNNFSEARQHALKIGKEKGFVYISGSDHPNVIQGNGSIGIEILEQVPDVDAVIVTCGGGGLLAGVCTVIKELKPNCQVIGIESESVPGMTKSMEAGRPVAVENKSTIAEGLAVLLVGYNTFATCKDCVDKMVTITEECIATAILRLIELEKCVIEGSGAASVGALLSGKLDTLKGKKVVCILSGGNIDTTILSRSLERGLATDGRLLKVDVTIRDAPGELGKLLTEIGEIGVNVKHVIQERAWIFEDVHSVNVRLICETRDFDHALQLRNFLTKNYKAEFPKFPSRPRGYVKESKKSCTCDKN